MWVAKERTELIWHNSYQEAFEKVKSMVCKDTTLQYFDVHKQPPVGEYIVALEQACTKLNKESQKN